LIKKVKSGIATLHEDLQYDFQKELDSIIDWSALLRR
jgi:hypothetical protein